MSDGLRGDVLVWVRESTNAVEQMLEAMSGQEPVSGLEAVLAAQKETGEGLLVLLQKVWGKEALQDALLAADILLARMRDTEKVMKKLTDPAPVRYLWDAMLVVSSTLDSIKTLESRSPDFVEAAITEAAGRTIVATASLGPIPGEE